MSTPSERVAIFNGPNLHAIGTPLVIITMSGCGENYRKLEAYGFVITGKGAKQLFAKSFNANNISPALISDQSLADMIRESVQGDLDAHVFEKAKELGREIVPYLSQFTLQEINLEKLQFYLIRHRMQDGISLMKRNTECELLKKHLKHSNLPAATCSIDEQDIK